MRNGKATPRSLSRAGRRGASGEAEGEGFEPSMVLPMPVFKTGAIGRSATPPCEELYRPTPRGASQRRRPPSPVRAKSVASHAPLPRAIA
jgi:hypothetical protein